MIRMGRILREVLLTTAALAGAACILLVVLAFTGGYSLIMFKTGSMTPTIPAGSVALVQKVPATDLHVGDVVTVDRPGALPVTHRITSIKDGSKPDERIITMQGDANDSEDPAPYTITEVRIVRGSVPGVATIIVQFGNPWVLGGLTIGASLLVTWAFWPRNKRSDADAGETEESTADAVAIDPMAEAASDSNVASENDVAPDAGKDGATVLRSSAALVALGLALTPLFAAPVPASAAPSPGHLVVRSSLEGAGVQQLDPIEPLLWDVDIDASAAPENSTLDISYSSSGSQDFRLQAEVRSCGVAWRDDGSCTENERLLRQTAIVPADGEWKNLRTTDAPDRVYLRIALTAEPMNTDAGSAGASLTVRATAAGETVDTGIDNEPPLVVTGGHPLAIFAAPAALLVGVGAALLARRYRREAAQERRSA